MRLARVGATARTLRSETAEEAPIGIGAWMRQRSRWVKGWMQTWIVHNRRPDRLLAELGLRNFLFFQIFVGGMILSSLLHSVFLIMLGLRLALGEPMVLDDGWDLACLGILIVGYGGSILLVLSALIRQRRWRLIPWQLLLPLYWVLHTLAAMRAAHELLQKPYAWSKTEHGRTRLVRGPAAAVEDDSEITPAAQRW